MQCRYLHLPHEPLKKAFYCLNETQATISTNSKVNLIWNIKKMMHFHKKGIQDDFHIDPM